MELSTISLRHAIITIILGFGIAACSGDSGGGKEGGGETQ